MDLLKHTFTRKSNKTDTIGTYTDTFILIHGEIESQKFYLQSGTYVERERREIIAQRDFELIKPKPHEKVLSFVKPVADEGTCLECVFYFGMLHEVMLAELYHRYSYFPRAFFNYSRRHLIYGDREHNYVEILPGDRSYLVNVQRSQPAYKQKFGHVFDHLTNEYKLIDKLLKRMKVWPPGAAENTVAALDFQKFVLKYYPLAPYK